ncbi:uncharacterized protein IWZ02DRAFT_299001 [Phyllosticta citriasiana]|uniref:uncharacterized protein n=1 Tax=Phyllosticta citriasiana TaxID=595635 RepID=UPI0030FDA076
MLGADQIILCGLAPSLLAAALFGPGRRPFSADSIRLGRRGRLGRQTGRQTGRQASRHPSASDSPRILSLISLSLKDEGKEENRKRENPRPRCWHPHHHHRPMWQGPGGCPTFLRLVDSGRTRLLRGYNLPSRSTADFDAPRPASSLPTASPTKNFVHRPLDLCSTLPMILSNYLMILGTPTGWADTPEPLEVVCRDTNHLYPFLRRQTWASTMAIPYLNSPRRRPDGPCTFKTSLLTHPRQSFPPPHAQDLFPSWLLCNCVTTKVSPPTAAEKYPPRHSPAFLHPSW